MKKVTAALLASMSLVGCGKLEGMFNGPSTTGSGKIKTEARHVSGFHQIEIGGATLAEVKVGPKESVEITTDDNVMPLVRTEVHNGKLVIDHKGSISNSHIKAVITLPSLDGVEVSGAGQMKVSGIHSSSLSADLSGASKLEATGQADKINLEASGASKAELGGLEAKNARVSASGASHLSLAASSEIQGSLSGASHLKYTGSPRVDVSTSGASSVSKG